MLNLEIVSHDFSIVPIASSIYLHIDCTIYCIYWLRVKFFVILNKQFAFNLYVEVVVAALRVFIVHLFIANC